MSLPHATIQSFCVTLASADADLPANTLARIRFGVESGLPRHPRDIHIPLQSLNADQAELWLSDLPVACGEDQGLCYAENGEVLFGSLRVAETGDLARLTHDLYARIEKFRRERGYPHFLRAWNFLTGINQGEGDAERYRHFSTGRHEALAAYHGFEARLPAGTAIGTPSGELIVQFLAAKSAGLQIENPRQLSAFRYPRQYGPKAPSFARAVLARGHLLVSGTASIVGHTTLHSGDVIAQLHETHANLLSLVHCAAERHGLDPTEIRPEALRLYLRHRRDWPAVERAMKSLFGAAPVLALHGDICRADLDLEIEGVYTMPARERA